MATLTETTMRETVIALVKSAMAKFAAASTHGKVTVNVSTVDGRVVARVTAKVTSTWADFIANEERDVRWAIRNACERAGLATDSDGAVVMVCERLAAAA